MKVWVVFAKSCSECGGKAAVRTCSAPPDQALIQEVAKLLGGMWCISTQVIECELDGPPAQHEGDEP